MLHEQKWFIQTQNFIKGPFSPDEIQKHLSSLGEDLKDSFLWARGKTEWIRADRWHLESHTDYEDTASGFQNSSSNENFIPEIVSTEKQNISKELKTDLFENIKVATVEKFKVQYDFVDQKEMTYEELVQFTAKQEDVSKIAIFDKKTNQWEDVYHFPEIINKLGISRRKNQRVPILAQFIGKNLAHIPVVARVVTISVGGIGMTDNFDLKLADQIKGQLTSPHFYSPITISAEVTYAGLDGYVGLKFIEVNDEGHALITDYVKKFGKEG